MWRITAYLVTAGLLEPLRVAARQAHPRSRFLGAALPSLGGEPRTALGSDGGAADDANPLLRAGDLPDFAAVRAEHALPAVQYQLRRGAESLRLLEASLEASLAGESPEAAYEVLVLPLEGLYQSVGRPWELLAHLKQVRDGPPLRAAIEELQPKVVDFWQGVRQSKPIYKALLQLSSSPGFAALPEARRRIVHGELLERRLGGVGLEPGPAAEFNAAQRRLSNLSAAFGNRVLDARKAWNVTLDEPARVRGIPPRVLAAAAEAARGAGHANASAASGPWLLTLDTTQLGPALTYAEDRELREALLRASATLATRGPEDNSRAVAEILDLRQREAELLGFPSYAALSLASKMANLSSVHRLLDDLQATAKPAAQKEDDELLDFARRTGGPAALQPWDRPFLAERLRLESHGVDAEQLRDYFAYPAVVEGLFGLCRRLFDASVEPEAGHGEALWHPDVRLYRVVRGGEVAGYVFMDPYSRPSEKRAGAWVQPLTARESLGGRLQRPAAAIVTNFPPPLPGGEKPSLLSLDEVDTLFHEFGHALQHVLTLQNESAVSGLNGIEWDAVEVASQFMEYWASFDRGTLYSFARHHATGEPLPEEIYQRLQAARGFRAGSGLLGQIYMGKLDMRVHEGYHHGEDTNAIEKALAKEVLVAQPLPEARLLCSFGHVFSGSYAAGYYSYQWSKVLSADAFSAFDSGGALKDPGRARAIGLRFAATLLALGGGRDPAQVFADFRGRAPTTDALLRYSGLVPAAPEEGAGQGGAAPQQQREGGGVLLLRGTRRAAGS